MNVKENAPHPMGRMTNKRVCTKRIRRKRQVAHHFRKFESLFARRDGENVILVEEMAGCQWKRKIVDTIGEHKGCDAGGTGQKPLKKDREINSGQLDYVRLR